MPSVVIRNAAHADFEDVCELNRAEVQHTSPMDEARLAILADLSCYFKVATVEGCTAAFLLAMREGAPYANENFAWFAGKFARFIYVDRIVVSRAFKGLRIGSMLYEDLFRFARDCAIPVVTCEYNIEPPNDASRRFHDKFGFSEQGTQWLAGGAKQVSLQAVQIR
jgi:predicted GNAT superfamily acetyltransferase